MGLLALILVAINAGAHRPALTALGLPFRINAPVVSVLFYLVVAWAGLERSRWTPLGEMVELALPHSENLPAKL